MQRTELEKRIERCVGLLEEKLSEYIGAPDPDTEKLNRSMKYSLLMGGKRIRPYLTLEFARALGGDENAALVYAAALEMIHTYSLIHDDLPAMDNDDYRRGKLTNHKVFGEATAILAGDALLTKAFEITAENSYASFENRVCAVKILSKAAGDIGMIGGQQMDMSADAGITKDKLEKLQSLKTGALIRCAGELGVLSAGKYGDEKVLGAAREYCELIGRAFQVTDDILDATETVETMGKSLSDASNGKLTFLSFMSVEEAREYARELTERACRAVADIDRDGALCSLAEYLFERKK